MLKTGLYYLMLLTTTVRFGDMIFLLTKDNTNLPVPVIAVTTAMILYGIGLAFYRFIGTIRMKQLVTFYVMQTAMIAFNLLYVALFCPLQMSAAEILVVGTLLDLIVNIGLIYVSMKRMRSFVPMEIGKQSLHV